MVFNPTLQGAPQSEAPVAAPAPRSPFADVLGSIATGLGQIPQPKAPSAGDLKKKAVSNLMSAADRAGQMIRGGKAMEGRRVLREAATQYHRTGHTFDSALTTSIESATGEVFDLSFKGEEDFTKDKIRSTPAYTQGVLYAHSLDPSLKGPELDSAALNYVQSNETRLAQIEQTKNGDYRYWKQEGQVAYNQQLVGFLGEEIGGLELLRKNGIPVSVDDLALSKARWDSTKVMLSRPSNVPDDEWQGFQSRIDSIDQFFNTAIENPKVFNDMKKQVLMSTVVSAMQAGGVDERVITSYLSDPASFVNLNQEMFAEMLQASTIPIDQAPSVFALEPQTTPTPVVQDGEPEKFFNPEVIANADSDPSSLRARASAVGSKFDFGNSASVDTFVSQTQALNAGMVKLMGEQKDVPSLNFLNQVYGESFWSNLSEIYRRDPIEGQALINQTRAAMGASSAQLARWFGTVSSSSNLRIVKDTGKVSIDLAAFDEANSDVFMDGMTPSQMLVKAAEEYYAGDMDALLKDDGRKIRGLQRDVLLQRLPTQDNTIRSLVAAQGWLRGKDEHLVEMIGLQQNNYQTLLPKSVVGDEAFIQGSEALAEKYGANVQDLMVVFAVESKFDPSFKSTISSATGLIGFMQETAKNMGVDHSTIANMSRAEQLVLVDQYFQMVGLQNIANPDLADLYSAVFAPAAMGKADSFVVYRGDSAEYKANSGMDFDGDGNITKGDIRRKITQWSRGRIDADTLVGTGGSSTFGDTTGDTPMVKVDAPVQGDAPEIDFGDPMVMPNGTEAPNPSAGTEGLDSPETTQKPNVDDSASATDKTTTQRVESFVTKAVDELSKPTHTEESVEEFYESNLDLLPARVQRQIDRMVMVKLKGVTDPEKKLAVIKEVLENHLDKLAN